MTLFARYREAERAGLHSVAYDLLHGLDLRLGGAGLLAIVAHDIMAHCRMADQIADIDTEMVVEVLHVLRDRLPLELDSLQHLHRDRFDVGEELGEPLLGALSDGSQRQRAIAEDNGSGPVLGREGAERVPGDLRVVMAMIVDKAGADRAAVGVDRLRRRAGELADLGDLAVLDPDIGAEARHAGTVDDASVLDQQIIRHRLPPAQPGTAAARPLAGTLSRNPTPQPRFPGMGWPRAMQNGRTPGAPATRNRSRSTSRCWREDVSQYGVVTDAGARRIRLLMPRARQFVHGFQRAQQRDVVDHQGFSISRLDMRAGDDCRDTVLRRAGSHAAVLHDCRIGRAAQIGLVVVVLVEGDDEEAVMGLGPLVIAVEIFREPAVARGDRLLRRAVMHVVLLVGDHESDGGKLVVVGREIDKAQIRGGRDSRAVRDIGKADPWHMLPAVAAGVVTAGWRHADL